MLPGVFLPLPKLKFVLILFASILLQNWPVWSQTFKIASFDVKLCGKLNEFKVTGNVEKKANNVEILTLRLAFPNPSVPPPFSLKWSLPSHNIAGFWSATTGFDKTVSADWYPSRVSSMLARSAPVFSLFGQDDSNRLCLAVSDALNTINMSAGLREEDGRIYCKIDFFTEKHQKLQEYKIQLRFDERKIPFYRALQQVPDWWASLPDYEPAPVPALAKLPMYSTWYSYHQNVSSEALLKEARIARELGFRAVIVDDGWQTLDSNRGYAYTGDWQPERMPDMKRFVEQLHRMDMKVLLWYAVPFMGEKAKNFERFKGKFLRYWNGQGTYVLDPRYPEVREYIISIYKKAIRDWNLDGFKLDFIARFAADKNTKLEIAAGRDYASVNEAADRLMTDILTELRKVKPNILIEFRQPYIGPLMRKYGNMFRVGDCPNVAVINRVGSVDLRLMSGNTAVHSDMIMWHYGESVETAALQFLNIMFAVPQVSVRLEDIPKDHFEMVKFLARYWVENRNVLVNGELETPHPQVNYPVITATGKNKSIVALYSDQIISLSKKQAINSFDVINAKTSGSIILDSRENLGVYQLTIRDCRGRIRQHKSVKLNKNVYRFKCPPSGMISFTRSK